MALLVLIVVLVKMGPSGSILLELEKEFVFALRPGDLIEFYPAGRQDLPARCLFRLQEKTYSIGEYAGPVQVVLDGELVDREAFKRCP